MIVVDEVGDRREDLVNLRNLECLVELLSILGVEVEVGLTLILDAIGGG